MKINEFNNPKKIDESLAGAMFGDVPMSALKGMLSGKGGKHQLAQDIFLRDFYQDAITSLDNGIKSGYVDPKKPYGTTSTTQLNTQPNTQFGNATPQNVGPATGAAGTFVTPTNATNALNAPTLAQPGTNVTTKVGTSGTPGSITTGGPGAPTTAAKPGTPTAKGYSFKTTQPGAPAQPQQTVKVPSQNVKINAPAAKQDPNDKQYKWAPKGMKITPNTPLSSLGATGKLAESTYHNLNNVFENVISEMNGEGDATTTITDHMLDWFGQYMDGANWESKKAAIIPQIKKIQDTYGSDKGKAAIKNLARLAYSITGQRGGGMPAGAKNAVQNTTGVAAGNQSGKELAPDQIVAALAALPREEQQKIMVQVQRLNVK
jgi:hypothetical protein